LVLALSLLAAFWAYTAFPLRSVYTAAAILVPFNAVLALAFAERGARVAHAWRWVALIAAEFVVVFLLRHYISLDNFLLRSPPTPLAARLMFGIALSAAVARGWPSFTPVEVGLGAALAAFFVACEYAGSPATFALFVSAAGIILLVAVLHESHRMAFRDALTGLPNRRALEEQLRALGSQYAIGMVDVDHFKSFNDTHGHDIGDQVLRLVASRLAEVEGGGRAFRYGGEEFTVLFPGQTLAEALPHLEKLRGAVEAYKMAVRADDRPKSKDTGKRQRVGRAADKSLSVTVSIGAAQPSKKLKTPQEVVKGADEALYRAKQGGRNRVSN
jgi:diguanylate cyclase (GGDEF)-like protein